MLSTEQLDNWFTYHAPTEEQKPKYDAIKEAADIVVETIDLVRRWADSGCDPDSRPAFDVVNTACRNFAVNVDTHCPGGADATASLRCIRLVRNALNEQIAKGFDASSLCVDMAIEQLHYARWQANSAIAYGGK